MYDQRSFRAVHIYCNYVTFGKPELVTMCNLLAFRYSRKTDSRRTEFQRLADLWVILSKISVGFVFCRKNERLLPYEVWASLIVLRHHSSLCISMASNNCDKKMGALIWQPPPCPSIQFNRTVISQTVIKQYHTVIKQLWIQRNEFRTKSFYVRNWLLHTFNRTHHAAVSAHPA